MKIKGPGNYSGLPAPPEDVKGGEGKGGTKFPSEQSGIREAEPSRKSAGVERPGSFETNLRGIAKASGKDSLSNEATVNRVVDSVLEQMLGPGFLAGKEAAPMKAAMVPMLSQDEHFMNKLNHVLARLQKA